MIRGGSGTGPFNTDYNVKLFFFIITLLMVIWEFKKNNKREYIGLLITGALMWGLAELFLQLSKTRDFIPVSLFGVDLPFIIQICIQGVVEGAFVAIFCMFFSDRIIFIEYKKEDDGKNKRRLFSIVFIILMGLLIIDALKYGIQTPDYGGDVPSRRSMFEPIPLTFLAIMVVIDLIFLIRASSYYKKKGLYMTLLMIVFGAVWTIGEYIAGTRWIEIGIEGATNHAPPLVEFLALAFDIIIEIALAYLPFLAIPYFLVYHKPEIIFGLSSVFLC
ncbi:MAG: hypothetical protein GF364_06335 [Candidatus Lokiarchaeota archaeon]|nr:hypothetical protein [Candidatus Lokiarchaeota archaeon]